MKLFILGRKCIAPAAVLALGMTAASLSAQNNFHQTNLVSDVPSLARFTDPNLVNPWGISEGPTTPFWVSDAGTGRSTLYGTDGTPRSLVVTIPGQGPVPSVPTGQVFDGGNSAFNGDLFLFASATGQITGWRPALGTTAETLFTPAGASYTGLAIGSVGASRYLYGADFGTGMVDVFGSGPTLSGNFTDPMLPSGYAPFNIQNIGNMLYVTYALRGADGHDVAGLGNGFVDVYDLSGNLVTRLVSGGALDSPWGLAIAPTGFGGLAGDLLVGNFGNGWINVYNPTNGDWIDSLRDDWGNPVVIDGLWALQPGNGAGGGDANKIYFTAGIDGETHGLFGSFTAVPEASTVYGGFALVGACAVTLLRRKRRAA